MSLPWHLVAPSTCGTPPLVTYRCSWNAKEVTSILQVSAGPLMQSILLLDLRMVLLGFGILLRRDYSELFSGMTVVFPAWPGMETF